MRIAEIIVIALFGFLFSTYSIAHVRESDEYMDAGTHNALIIKVDVNDARFVDRVWKDYMKKFGGKVKKIRGGSETVTTDASIVGVNGVEDMQVFAKTSGGSGSNVQLVVWFDLGSEYLTSSMKGKFLSAEKFLADFAQGVKVAATDNELSDAEKKLRALENDLDKLRRQNNGYHKDIEDAERKIAQAKENIIKNEGQQTEAEQIIELQKEVVGEIKSRLDSLRKN